MKRFSILLLIALALLCSGNRVAHKTAGGGGGGNPAYTFVQQAYCSSFSTMKVATLTAAIPSGNRAVVCFLMGNVSSAAPNSISDSKGNTWTLDKSEVLYDWGAYIYSSPIGTALNSGDTITVTTSQSSMASDVTVFIGYISNVTSTDVSGTFDVNSTTVSVSISPTAKSVIVAIDFSGSTLTPTVSFNDAQIGTVQTGTPLLNSLAASRTVSAAGATTIGWVAANVEHIGCYQGYK